MVCLTPQPVRTESVLSRIGRDNPGLLCGSRAIKNRDFVEFSRFSEESSPLRIRGAGGGFSWYLVASKFLAALVMWGCETESSGREFRQVLEVRVVQLLDFTVLPGS